MTVFNGTSDVIIGVPRQRKFFEIEPKEVVQVQKNVTATHISQEQDKPSDIFTVWINNTNTEKDVVIYYSAVRRIVITQPEYTMAYYGLTTFLISSVVINTYWYLRSNGPTAQLNKFIDRRLISHNYSDRIIHPSEGELIIAILIAVCSTIILFVVYFTLQNLGLIPKPLLDFTADIFFRFFLTILPIFYITIYGVNGIFRILRGLYLRRLISKCDAFLEYLVISERRTKTISFDYIAATFLRIGIRNI